MSLILTASVQSAAMAADFQSPKTSTAGQSLPGAYVSMEGGVRVIRPLPFDPAWVVDEETAIPGGVVYHGAAFYRVPSVSGAKTGHRAKPVQTEKPHAE